MNSTEYFLNNVAGFFLLFCLIQLQTNCKYEQHTEKMN